MMKKYSRWSRQYSQSLAMGRCAVFGDTPTLPQGWHLSGKVQVLGQWLTFLM